MPKPKRRRKPCFCRCGQPNHTQYTVCLACVKREKSADLAWLKALGARELRESLDDFMRA